MSSALDRVGETVPQGARSHLERKWNQRYGSQQLLDRKCPVTRKQTPVESFVEEGTELAGTIRHCIGDLQVRKTVDIDLPDLIDRSTRSGQVKIVDQDSCDIDW